MSDISRLAVVEKTARLAEGVRVGPFCYIGPEAIIGEGCIIESGASIVGRTTLAARCRVFPLAVIGASPGGEGKADQPSRCILGEANDVREHAIIYGGTDKPTQIGNDNLIMIGCQIGPGATVGDHCILTNYTQINGGAVIEDYVGTSAFTFVGANTTVGAYTYIAGFTGVEGAAPPFAMVQGYPCRVRGVNSEKLRRCGFGDDDIRALKEAFRELFDGTGAEPDFESLERLSLAPSLNPHVRRLIQTLQGQSSGGS